MTGFWVGAPVDSAAAEAVAGDLVPSSSGQVLGAVAGQALHDLPTAALARAAREGTQWDPGADYQAEAFDQTTAEASMPPLLDPKVATKRYGIPGALSFDQPVPEAVAAEQHDAKQAELRRQDVIARGQGGLTGGWAARTGTEFLVGLLDPLNLAATFIPGAPEAKVAALFGDGLAARIGTRAVVGATQGIAGQAALLPLADAAASMDHDDFTMGTALSQLAFGGVMGGALHAALGGAADLIGRRYARSEAAAAIAADPELAEGVGRTAVVQMAEGRPVEVEPLIDQAVADETPVSAPAPPAPEAAPPIGEDEIAAAEAGFTPPGDATEGAATGTAARADGTVRLYHGGQQPDGGPRWVTPDRAYAQAYAEKSGGRVWYADVPADHPEVVAATDYDAVAGTDTRAPLRSFEASGDIAGRMRPLEDAAPEQPLPPLPPAPKGGRARKPVSLLPFLAARGGLRDQGGDLAAMDAHKAFIPGRGMLVRQSGMVLDRAREAAEEAGYLPADSTVADLLDRIDDELRGRRTYSAIDQGQVAADAADAQAQADTARYLRARPQVDDVAARLDAPIADGTAHAAAMDVMQGALPEDAVAWHMGGPDGEAALRQALDAAAGRMEPGDAASSGAAADAAAEPPPATPFDIRRVAGLEEAQDWAARTREAGALAPEDEAELAAIEAEQAAAEGRGNALKQAAACISRGYGAAAL